MMFINKNKAKLLIKIAENSDEPVYKLTIGCYNSYSSGLKAVEEFEDAGLVIKYFKGRRYIVRITEKGLEVANLLYKIIGG